MAIFDSKEGNSSSAKVVRPTVIRTQNIAQELTSIADSNKVRIDTLDFNILDVQTYTRIKDEKEEVDWNIIENRELYELDDEQAILNPLFEIKQTYEIEVFSINQEEQQLFKNMKIAVGANASKCKVYLSIAAESSLEYDENLEEELKQLINKKKIRAGILINIFDEMVDDVVSQIAAQTKVNEKLVYAKKATILIAEAYEPTPTIDDDLVKHYEKKDNVDEGAKIDYASRGFVESVKSEELLLEYVKPQLGEPGRNCRGQYMQPKEPIVANEVSFSVDSTIKEFDEEDSIKYVAQESGYMSFESGEYSIKTDMDIDSIDFKTTGNIMSGVDSDVSISVKEGDAVKDAIGSGMSVEVTDINIEGNVGSNARVTAINATIAGQTHGTSIVKADVVDINVHKGKAYGEKIKITRLEHGEVNGDEVSITQAMGGNIRAKEIDIDICNSHVQATASSKIEIHRLQGSENIFTIDPLIKKVAQEGLEENQEEIKKIEKELFDGEKELAKYTKMIQSGAASFLDIKKRLIAYKKKGVKAPTSFVQKYKQFIQMKEDYDALQAEQLVTQDLLKLKTRKTAAFQDNILDARVINRDHWLGYNEIRFKLVDPPIELVHKPEQGTSDKIFGLVELNDGTFEIQAMEE